MVKKQLLRECLPPLSLRAKHWVDAKRGKIGSFKGRFQTWEQASRASVGYHESSILEKVTEATEVIISAEHQFERDAVIFNAPQFSYPILAHLLKIALKHETLHVLDFGGALGSSYFQIKQFAPDTPLSWHVVEQPHFVQRGQSLLKDESTLGFYNSIEESVAVQRPHVILLSGVLQYLEKPQELLTQCFALNPDAILIDRCPVADLKRDWLTVQKVPKSIYSASYPAWIFAKQQFMANLSENTSKLQTFMSIDGQVDTLKGMVTYIGISLEK